LEYFEECGISGILRVGRRQGERKFIISIIGQMKQKEHGVCTQTRILHPAIYKVDVIFCASCM
jgi:hypothetical protein